MAHPRAAKRGVADPSHLFPRPLSPCRGSLWREPRLSLSKARRVKLDKELARQARLGEVRDIEFPAGALKTH